MHHRAPLYLSALLCQKSAPHSVDLQVYKGENNFPHICEITPSVCLRTADFVKSVTTNKHCNLDSFGGWWTQRNRFQTTFYYLSLCHVLPCCCALQGSFTTSFFSGFSIGTGFSGSVLGLHSPQNHESCLLSCKQTIATTRGWSTPDFWSHGLDANLQRSEESSLSPSRGFHSGIKNVRCRLVRTKPSNDFRRALFPCVSAFPVAFNAEGFVENMNPPAWDEAETWYIRLCASGHFLGTWQQDLNNSLFI